jgi:putative endonuclease
MFYVYILYSCKLDRYYTGSAEDIPSRLIRHNKGAVKATKNGIQWEFKYSETFTTRAEALKRELEIKRKKSRKYIEWLINNKR